MKHCKIEIQDSLPICSRCGKRRIVPNRAFCEDCNQAISRQRMNAIWATIFKKDTENEEN